MMEEPAVPTGLGSASLTFLPMLCAYGTEKEKHTVLAVFA